MLFTSLAAILLPLFFLFMLVMSIFCLLCSHLLCFSSFSTFLFLVWIFYSFSHLMVWRWGFASHADTPSFIALRFCVLFLSPHSFTKVARL